MLLTKEQKRAFAALAHHKKPIVTIGAKGLTDAVLAEIDLALNHHELMKIKMQGVERDDRHPMAETICSQLNATLILEIGQILVVFREAVKKKSKVDAKAKVKTKPRIKAKSTYLKSSETKQSRQPARRTSRS